MQAIVNNTKGYPEIPLSLLTESPTNPRRQFHEDFLKGLASTIRNNGVLSPLLVRPKNGRYEIVFGAQRFRAAKMAEKETIPATIREMTDAEVLEAQLVELSLVVKRFLPFVGALHVVDMSTTCRVCV